MSAIKFLTIEDCDTVVRKYLETSKAKAVNFSAACLKNQNFLVKITVKHDSEEKTLNFFATSALKKPKTNKILFSDFQKTVPRFDPRITPKLYYDKSNLLLFEDLAWQGFCIYTDRFSEDHLKIVLKVLAKFHAASFAYEKIKSEETRSFYRLDQEYKFDSRIDLTKPEVTDIISSLLDDIKEETASKTIKELQNRQSSKKFRRVICHGNLILNNIMFKYSGKNPVECKLINFTNQQYTPPIYDVLQLIFFNTSEDLRQQHLHSLLNHYYRCLDEELGKYSVKIDTVLTSEDWKAQAHYCQPLIKLECVFRNIPDFAQELKEDLNCPLLSRQDCYAIMKNKLKTTSYNLISFKVIPFESASGFLGDYHKLLIEVTQQNKNTTIGFFVKCIPTTTASKEVVQDSNSFFKEAFVYQILVPKLQELGIDIIDDCLPKCYFQRPGDLMVFEDLSIDYRTQIALEPYDFETLCIVVKKLAKFHASAFIYEEKVSKKLDRRYRLNEEYGEYFKEAIIVEDEGHSGGKLMATGLRSILDAANLFPELQTEENRKNLEEFWPQLCRLFYSTLKASDCFRNVLTHGDLWSSNVLIKFEDNKAIDCRFVDYQLLRYCPPGHDLLSIFHLTTIRELRLKHEEQITRIYYEELGTTLKSFDYVVEDIIPYDDFIGGINLMRPQMVIEAAIYGMFSMCTPDQISSLLSSEEESNRVFFEDRKDFLAKMCAISLIYKSRLRDRIQDVYDYCNSLSKQ